MATAQQVFFLLTPAIIGGLAQMVAVRLHLLAWLARPLDGNLLLAGQPLFGATKTVRGLVVMVATTTVAAGLIYPLAPNGFLPPGFAPAREPAAGLMIGFLFGLGYILGELPNSFIKRRLGLPPGARPSGSVGRLACYLADQVDSVAAVALLLVAFHQTPWLFAGQFVLVGTVTHVGFDWLMYLVGFKPVRLNAVAVPGWLIRFCLTVVYLVARVVGWVWPAWRTEVTPVLTTEPTDSVILVANHLHRLDPVFATSALPWRTFQALLPIRYMTDDSYLRTNWQQLLLLPLGCFPAHGAGDTKGLDLASRFLAAQATVFIFPEGKRVRGEVCPQAKSGVAVLARMSQRSLVPIYLKWHQPARRWRPGLTVRVGPPFTLSGQTQKPTDDAQAIMQRVYSLQGE